MSTPIYQRIKQQLIEDIETMEANSPLSSERELALSFSASRMTVRKAITELVSEGYLYRDANKGTFTSDKELIMKNSMQEYQSLTYTLLYFDVKDGANSKVQQALRIRHDDSIVRMVRILSEDKDHVAIEEVYVKRNNLSDDDVREMPHWRSYDSFLEQGTVLHDFRSELVPVKYAKLLNMKLGDPIIVVDSILRDKRGNPIVLKITYNNTHKRAITVMAPV